MFDQTNKIIIPDWPAPKNVRAFVTTRRSFIDQSKPSKLLTGYDAFNLALHVNDDPERVLYNRQTLAYHLATSPDNITWLEQVHGTDIVSTESITNSSLHKPSIADASNSKTIDQPCTVMTADCLPVLFCNITDNNEAKQVAAAHAGWRGLADGILSKTLSTFSDPESVIAWLGPAISQANFEVGQEVYDCFINKNPENKRAFIASPNASTKQPKWLASLNELAKIELKQKGIKAIYGGEHCTYEESDLFYSYRRDGAQSGRMASLIMLTD